MPLEENAVEPIEVEPEPAVWDLTIEATAGLAGEEGDAGDS